jgi:hypothetical protein
MAALQVMSFSGWRGALHGVKLTERGADAVPGVFIIGHLVKEGDAHPLQGLCGLDGVNGMVKWCVQVHDGNVRGVLLWEWSDLLLRKKAFERQACDAW